MNTEEEKKPKSFWKEKMMRLKIVVLIRKNIFLFSLLLVFSLSLLLGFWNITKHEVINIDGEDIDRSIFLEIEKYFDENISSFNYFLFSPKEHQKNMYSNIAEVKKVRIETVSYTHLDVYKRQSLHCMERLFYTFGFRECCSNSSRSRGCL